MAQSAAPMLPRSLARAGRARRNIAWMIALLLFTSCAPMPVAAPPPDALVPSQQAPDFVQEEAERAAPALVRAERNAAAAGDLALLAQLWAADARIVEARAPDDARDDYVWQGRAAILDRYTVAVFPNPPPPLDALPAAAPTVTAGSATLENGVDRWRFTWDGERWWLQELTIAGS